MSVDNFGSILKNLRTRAGLSQDDVAKKLAISRQSISKWELGMSLPDITYLVPLTKILNCEIEELLNLKRKDVDKVNDIKVIVKKNIKTKEFEELIKLYDNGDNNKSWVYHTVRFMNLDYNEMFFVVGLNGNELVSAANIQIHPEENDYYLVSDIAILDEYDNDEFRKHFLSTILTILKDLNCTKVGAFVDEDYKELYEKLGFTKVSDDFIFGTDKRSVSSNDKYYELIISQEYYCEEINKDTAKIIAYGLIKKKEKYSKDVPGYFKQTGPMLREYLMYKNTIENEKVYSIMNGKTICGYTSMYYEVDKNIYFRCDLKEEFSFKDLIKVATNKVKEFAEEIKMSKEVKSIIFYVNDNLLLKEEFEFYRKALIYCGFKTTDNVEFILN